jgi:hypothetical protein
MKRNSPEAAPQMAQIAYKLNTVTYVPHYRNGSVYVGPGYPKATKQRYSAEELLGAGDKPVQALLWLRGTYGIVSDVNP